ncbi:MAG TPA: protein kinase [Gemmataceae bacterium]|nr:protein kinase [Gemmataceae bacterium]
MTSNEQQSHPTGESLAGFAHGRLADDEAVAVAEHLDVCEQCQQAVLAIPNDPLFALLCSGSSTPLPHPELLDLAPSQVDEATPPELNDHPRYRLLQRLGVGGMGEVYKAEHRLLRRPVALKVINKQLTASPRIVERFQREMRAVALLSHPNLVQAHDAEQAGALHFLVMEFIEGTDLAALVEQQGPLPVPRACDYVRQAALGLAHAHEHGLVHRDIKPQNLMLTPQGEIKVLDFGLAIVATEPRGEGGLTGVNTPMGTPDYVAPEQIRDAHSANTQADIYSLGCTLYFLLTGRPPFPEGNVGEKVAAHLQRQPESLAALCPGIPPRLIGIVNKMMAKAPASRFQSPAEVVTALGPFCQPAGQQVSKRSRWKWWAAAAGLLVLAAGIGLALVRVQTNYGALEIDTRDEAVEVLVRQQGKLVEVIDTRKKRTVQLKTGAYELELAENGRSLELSSNQITLTREGKIIAVLKRAEPVTTEIICDADHETFCRFCRKLEERRLQPVFLHVHDAGGKPRFCVIAKKSESVVRWHLYYGGEDQTGDIPPDMKGPHCRPLSGTSYRDGDTRRYASLWCLDKGVRASLSFGASAADYEAKLKDMKKKQQRPAQLNIYPTAKDSGLGVIWEKDDGTPYRVRHDLTAEEYRRYLDTGRAEGYRPISVSACPQKGRLLFTAVLLKDKPQPEWNDGQGLTAAEFTEQNKRMTEQGYRPLILSGYWHDEASRYLAVWVKGKPR